MSAMMVNRYFGSKENLFAEVVDTSFTPRTVVPDDLTSPRPNWPGRASNDMWNVTWRGYSAVIGRGSAPHSRSH
ncbi:hypothetical protein [Streptomyces sp. NPDC048521]|uniref:hypothetical protein n=1 Tax=Streptomyces sp. NPDC048521 TaxID=3365566 RepID=UPI003721E04F